LLFRHLRNLPTCKLATLDSFFSPPYGNPKLLNFRTSIAPFRYFPAKELCTFLITLMSSRCPANLLCFYNLYNEEYKLWSSQLCSLLRSLIASSDFGPNIVFNALSQNYLNMYFALNMIRKFTPMKEICTCIVLCTV
jgi:hypothetical protein